MKTILIVEDDPFITTALEIRLKANGYNTICAGDAVSGLSQAVKHRPELIILDVSLPAGDGLQLARRLKGIAETRDIPTVFVTANKDPDLREKVMDLGSAGLFEKPYDADELLAIIGHALGETGMFHRPIARYATAGEVAPAASGTTGRKKVLIVEDDQNIALALALRLQAAGYETSMAHDALTGVKSALSLQPDLVLLDISMPAGSGFTVAERMRSASPTPIPIIFLTASKQPGLRERAEELGAAGYFEKPYEADALLTAVYQHLGA